MTHPTSSYGQPPTALRRDPQWVTWRRAQLLSAGFDTVTATKLAATRGLDLHALLELVARGCDRRLATRIVAPSDHRREEALP